MEKRGRWLPRQALRQPAHEGLAPLAGAFCEDNSELVIGQAGEDVRCPLGCLYYGRHVAEYLVAAVPTVLLVYRFQAIDVEDGKGKRAFIAVRPCHLLLKAEQQIVLVGETGHRVANLSLHKDMSSRRPDSLHNSTSPMRKARNPSRRRTLMTEVRENWSAWSKMARRMPSVQARAPKAMTLPKVSGRLSPDPVREE